jgi:hypothetical protein
MCYVYFLFCTYFMHLRAAQVVDDVLDGVDDARVQNGALLVCVHD